MKHLHRITILAFALAVAGCTSEKAREAALARMGDEVPPDFLVGPASVALTNLDGFSATIASSVTVDAVPHAFSGQLLERQGRLLFQPMTTAKSKKGKIIRGGMIFIWDTVSSRGNVVSEALQGYAPLNSPVHVTGVVLVSQTPVAEQANGHPCHRVESTVSLSDGSSAKLTEWRADDLNHLPVRVRTEGGGRLVNVDLTDIRLDLPDRELFSPPVAFTSYQSPLALINELLIRESSLKSGPTSGGQGFPNQPGTMQQPGFGRPY